MSTYLLEILRQKWRLLSVIVILLVINIVLGVMVSAYQVSKLTGLQEKWNSLRKQTTGTGKTDAAALYRQGTDDLAKLRLLIPEKREFARLLNELYESAASCAVEIGSVSYKPMHIKDEGLLSYQLSFAVNGSYAAVKSFLSDLQDNKELLVVDSVSFSNSDMYEEHVEMNLQVTLYLREGV